MSEVNKNSEKIYENWLIETNRQLTNENKELLKTNQDLLNEVAEKEKELDDYDVSKRYTKGLLKNLVEVSRLYLDISNFNEKSFINLRQKNIILVNESKNLSKIYISVMTVFLLIYFFFNNFNYHFVFYLFISSFSFACNDSIIRIFNIEYIDINEIKKKEIKTEIKKIEDSQNFLYEYIDNL